MWVAEMTNYPREIAEAALAHVIGGVEGAYNRSDLFDERRDMMAGMGRLLRKPGRQRHDQGYSNEFLSTL
jgi:hypothetical protein